MMNVTLAQQWLHDEFFTKPNSTQAADTDNLFMFILWVCIVSFIVLMGVMTFFMFKYHRSKQATNYKVSAAHNTTIELMWSIGPLLVLVPIFFWGFHGYIGKQAAPASAEIIRVTGKKWNWSMVYDNGGLPNELLTLDSGSDVPVMYVPAGRPIKLIFTSLDVIHAFYIPDFRTKIDVIPNRWTSMWFQALEPTKPVLDEHGNQKMGGADGKQPLFHDHRIFCAEYCGDNHSDMWAYLRVLSEADYQVKKKELTSPPKGLDSPGRGKFYAKQFGCTNCHPMEPGMKVTAPFWGEMWMQTVEFTNADPITLDEEVKFREYVTQSVYNPGAKIVKGYANAMSNFTGVVTLAQLEDLMAFMKTLSPHYKPPEPAPAPEGEKPADGTKPPEGAKPPEGEKK